MRQSNVIFGTLIFMFIVYITMKGQLPAYLDLFRAKQKDGGSGDKKGGNVLSNIGSAAIDKGKDVLADIAQKYFAGK